MAPIKDETVDALRDLVNKLESRIEQLEVKLQHAGGDAPARRTKSHTESIRMILMGPPGAGTESVHGHRKPQINSVTQVRAPKHPGSRRSSVLAI